ncbi:MAG: hypothetical protein KGZ96_10615 [Clostridia bacterium]|nr:hypothetical protein [Clostridia bacterium]
MMRNQNKLPKKFVEKLAQDLAVLMSSHEGALLALQLLENLPDEVKISLINNLSMVHSEEVAKFFTLIAGEYPEEKTGMAAERSLKKLQFAGITTVAEGLAQVNCSEQNFAKALVSKTRLKGAVSLVSLFHNQDQPETFDMFFFTLSFGETGIREFFYARELTGDQVRLLVDDGAYLEVSYQRMLALINIAYEHNLDYETLPALGHFIYSDLLDQATTETQDKDFDFYPVLADNITPQMLVNGICLAVRREDYRLLEVLADDGQVDLPETGLLLSSKIITEKREHGLWKIEVELISEEEKGLNRLTWEIQLEEKDDRFILTGIEEKAIEPLDWSWLEETLADNNLTIAYYVYQPHGVRLFIESLEGIEFFQEGGELDFFKWWDLEQVLQQGLTLEEAVIADFILGEEELIVITNKQEKLKEVQNLLESNLPYELELLDDDSVEVVYRIFDQEKMSFNQLIEQWTLTGSTRKEQLSTWLNTKFTELNGLTPLEASGSHESAKLLWALVKKISKLGKQSRDSMVDYRALLKSVGWGKKSGKNLQNPAKGR